MVLLVKYKAIWPVYMAKNALTIKMVRLRKATDFRKRHPRFFVRRSVWFYQLIYCIFFFKQKERNEIPNAEVVKRVFSPTRPTRFPDSYWASLLRELFSLDPPGLLHIKRQKFICSALIFAELINSKLYA